MNNETIKKLHKTAAIAVSVLTAVAAVCLSAGCIAIFLSGDKPFSTESVAKTFGYIQIPVYLCILATLFGFFLNFFFPVEEKKEKLGPNREMTLLRLRKTRDTENASENDKKAILSARRTSAVINGLSAFLYLAEITAYIYIVFSAGLFTRGDNSSAAITKNVTDALIIMLPFLALAIGTAFCRCMMIKALTKKECDLLSALPKKSKDADEDAEKAKNADRALSDTVIRTIIVFAAIACIVGGYISGGFSDVLAKAVAICTECIGLG